MKNNNIYNLTLSKIRNLSVDWDRAKANSQLFSTNPNYHNQLTRVRSVGNGYNTYFLRISKDGIEDISFASDYDMTMYKFDKFYSSKDLNANKYDIEIQSLFLDFINNLIYLGVLYGEIEDVVELTTIIEAHHFGSSKLYTWRTNFSDIKEKDILLVDTHYGPQLVEVARVFQVEKQKASHYKEVLSRVEI